MNQSLLKEISSPLLRAIISETSDTINAMKRNKITYKQGASEIAGYRSIVASVALDWSYNKGGTGNYIENKTKPRKLKITKKAA